MSKLLVLLVFTLIVMICNASDFFSSGNRMYPEQELRSQNRVYTLRMQRDCNLVIYRNGNEAIWATDTGGRGYGCYMDMQNDGNLVVYDQNRTPLWSSNSGGSRGNRLIMQDDGNLVIYAPVWASNTGSVQIAVDNSSVILTKVENA